MAEENINEIVEQAFEAETAQENQEPAPAVEEKAEVQQQEPAQTQEPTEPAEKPAQEKQNENVEEKPQDEPKQEVNAPKQVKREFIDSHWDKIDEETKTELTRLANENERNYLRAADAEYARRQFKRVLQPVQGYITEVAQKANIPENDVIRNCVDIMQKLNDNPTMVARNMIAQGNIVFEDPVSVIDTIAKTYGIEITANVQAKNLSDTYYNTNAQARYEARQARYAQQDDTPDNSVTDYVNNTPGIKALLENPDVSEKFLRQIQMERNADMDASDITIINRAAEMFAYMNAPKPQEIPQENKPTLAEQKMAKVVSPTASNPVEQQPVKREPLTPEQSVRETLRSMGLDD